MSRSDPSMSPPGGVTEEMKRREAVAAAIHSAYPKLNHWHLADIALEAARQVSDRDLERENERLREAGNAMADRLRGWPEEEAWRAALSTDSEGE